MLLNGNYSVRLKSNSNFASLYFDRPLCVIARLVVETDGFLLPIPRINSRLFAKEKKSNEFNDVSARDWCKKAKSGVGDEEEMKYIRKSRPILIETFTREIITNEQNCTTSLYQWKKLIIIQKILPST